jgi:uncharacterized membrane protein YgdD (TMEM256/DUF423 family)
MSWVAAGAVAMALAVMLGAFGAHGLQGRLDAYSMSVYEKAVFYHFVHALGLLIVSGLNAAGLLPRSTTRWVCGLLVVGIAFFSGSLYALALTGSRTLGAITPIGGVAFIAAWLVLAVCSARSRRPAP